MRSPATPASRKTSKDPKDKAKIRKRKKPEWTLGPIPEDVFSPTNFSPEPKGPQAPNIPQIRRLEYLVTNPDLYEVADAVLPRKQPGTRGRTPHFPPYIYMIFLAAISVFGTALATEANLQHPDMWNIVRKGVRLRLGDEEADALPASGPLKHHWTEFQPKLLRILPRLREASRDIWIRQALAQGLLAEDRPRGCWLRPHRSQVINVDATVVRPPSDQTEPVTIDEETGELRRHRVDPDAGIQIEGGGNAVYGKKIVTFSVRQAETPHSRVILDVDSARHRSPEEDPEREEEASTACRMANDILDRAPGVIAISIDTVWRGMHRAPLIRRGVIVYTPQHDGINPRPLQKYAYPGCVHDVYAAVGRSCERRITVEGKTLYNPLPVRELLVRGGRTNWRFYHSVEIPCRKGPHRELIPVYETAEDRSIDPRTKRKKFNRCEHIRQIPPHTDFGDRLKGFRQDSESNHSTLDYTHWDKRIPAYGAAGSLLLYIGYAWVNNSVALGTATESALWPPPTTRPPNDQPAVPAAADHHAAVLVGPPR